MNLIMNFKFLLYSAGLLIMMRQTKVTVRKKRISEHEGSGRICVNLYICCRKVMNPLWKRHQHMQKKPSQTIFLKNADQMGFPYSEKTRPPVNKVAISLVMESGHIKCVYGS